MLNEDIDIKKIQRTTLPILALMSKSYLMNCIFGEMNLEIAFLDTMILIIIVLFMMKN